MVRKEGDFSEVSYVLGIASIVFGIMLQFMFGLGFGIIGFILVMKNSSRMAKKAKKFNTIGMVVNVGLLLLSLGLAYYFAKTGTGPF